MKHAASPSTLTRLVDQLASLPGIGKRSAERIAFYLLKQPDSKAIELAKAIREFKRALLVCSQCGHISEQDPCPICNDPQRDTSTILVVEQPRDIASLELTGAYRGLYHVLMGRIALLEGIGPGQLNVDQLVRRVETGKIKEVVLGMNANLEGDGTALYLADRLAALGIKVSRLARGLPTGSNLDTVSKAVLSEAIQGRRTDF